MLKMCSRPKVKYQKIINCQKLNIAFIGLHIAIRQLPNQLLYAICLSLSIWGTLNLAMCADSSTNTQTDRKGRKKLICRMLPVMCHVSYVMFYMSRIACCVSPVTNTKFLIMHSRLVFKDQNKKNSNNKKTITIIETTKTQKCLKVCQS